MSYKSSSSYVANNKCTIFGHDAANSMNAGDRRIFEFTDAFGYNNDNIKVVDDYLARVVTFWGLDLVKLWE